MYGISYLRLLSTFYYCKSQANVGLTYHTLRVVDDGFTTGKPSWASGEARSGLIFFMFWAKHKP